LIQKVNGMPAFAGMTLEGEIVPLSAVIPAKAGVPFVSFVSPHRLYRVSSLDQAISHMDKPNTFRLPSPYGKHPNLNL